MGGFRVGLGPSASESICEQKGWLHVSLPSRTTVHAYKGNANIGRGTIEKDMASSAHRGVKAVHVDRSTKYDVMPRDLEPTWEVSTLCVTFPYNS